MVNKKTARAEKSKETKEKIYNSAYQLFNTYDYDDVTIDMIVKLAGVAKGSFYVHFKSKDALIQALILDYVKKIDADYKAHFEGLPEDMPVSDIILSMVGRISDVITGTIGYDRMNTLYRVQLSKTMNISSLSDINRDLYRIFAYLITKGYEKGELSSNISAESLTRHMIISFRGLVYEWCLHYPDFDLKEQALCHYKILMNGLINRQFTL